MAATPTQSHTDVAREYLAARDGVALHNSGRFGRLRVSGKDALDLLNRLSTNRVDTLPHGQSAMTVLIDERARIIDLLTIANMGEHLLVLTSPGTAGRVVEWLDRYTFGEEIAVQDASGATSQLSLMGPQAPALLSQLAGMDLSGLPEAAATRVHLTGIEAALVRRCAPVLASWDLVTSPEGGCRLWGLLAQHGATPMGHEAWNALRVERGVPIHGHELTDEHNPLEAGLATCISFSKGCYVGQEVVARLDTYGKLQRRLVRLRFLEDATAAEGDKLEVGGTNAGAVTSTARRPTDGAQFALGYVRLTALQPNPVLTVAGKTGTQAQVLGTVG